MSQECDNCGEETSALRLWTASKPTGWLGAFRVCDRCARFIARNLAALAPGTEGENE